MKRRQKKALVKTLIAATDISIGTITDLVLIEMFSLLSIATNPPKTMHQAIYSSCDALRWHESLNYETIKRAIYKLTSRGLLRRSTKRLALDMEITAIGRKRLASLFPVYRLKRPWDGHLYLISYDIPSDHNWSRDGLRHYIRTIGGALLQQSLWITPYNPTTLLDEFATKHQVTGTILVSKLGKDGAIGEEKIERLISRVYRLDRLADRYDEFLETYSRASAPSTNLAVDYASILKDDPQLPFELLPRDFPGDEAYRLFGTYFPIK